MSGGAMVERVARALLIRRGVTVVTADDEWPGFLADYRATNDTVLYADLHEALQDARAAIDAMREPTGAMVRTLNSYAQCEGYIDEGWAAAIAAALGEEGT